MTALPTQTDRFRSMHVRGEPLLLPNAWDVASAVVVAGAGAAAVATTSAGAAWSWGQPDGDHLDRAQVVDLVGRLVKAVDVPVSADIESGYGDTVEDVGETAGAVVAAGVSGVNIEDALRGGATPLRPVAEQVRRIARVREVADASGVGLFVNARTDTYLSGTGDPSDQLSETLTRAAAYLEAGADGIFVPGVVDESTIARLVDGIDAPINVMVGPGAPTVAELAGLGVARISLGAGIATAAYGLVQRATLELLNAGTYGAIDVGLDYVTFNGAMHL